MYHVCICCMVAQGTAEKQLGTERQYYIGLEKLEDKFAGGIKSLRKKLQDCCDWNQHKGYGDDDDDLDKRTTDYYSVTCPPYGKVQFDL